MPFVAADSNHTHTQNFQVIGIFGTPIWKKMTLLEFQNFKNTFPFLLLISSLAYFFKKKKKNFLVPDFAISLGLTLSQK